ncbi:MAG: hypothetical protein IJA53_00115 [Spirochaetaceae bacterium]|nr:hypothetical protein [Spirochaetaceae bacterium]
MSFFDEEGFLEPLSKILISYGLCSERSFSTFFKNHNIFADDKLLTDKKCFLDRETTKIVIEKKAFENFGGEVTTAIPAEQVCISREATQTVLAGTSREAAPAEQVCISRETAPLSKDYPKAKDYIVLSPKSHLYILMNKPKNCVCSRVSDKSQTVYEVLELALSKIGANISQEQLKSLSSLGRLDKDTTGLLLFSTNGSFNHYVTDEKNKIPKTYYVKLKKSLTKTQQIEYKKKLEDGIWLEAEKKAKKVFVKNQKVQWESENTCFFTIEQGIFHQIRRSFLSLGNEVVELHRKKIGDFELPIDLNFGNVKILLKKDIVKK